MIGGFESYTEPLSDYEKGELLPVIALGLRAKVGKSMAVTNRHIVACLKDRYKISEARVRKVINYIRVCGIIPCLVATSDGYYVAESREELKEYITSLRGREDAIRAVRESLTEQMEERYAV